MGSLLKDFSFFVNMFQCKHEVMLLQIHSAADVCFYLTKVGADVTRISWIFAHMIRFAKNVYTAP